jgi:hypothetical protein
MESICLQNQQAFALIAVRALTVSNNGQTEKVYEVSLIDKNAEAKPENLLAMCPMCSCNLSD